MLQQLAQTLLSTDNQAADDLLLQALRLGSPSEQQTVLELLLRRKTSRGLAGVIGLYDRLPEALRDRVVEKIRDFHHAIAECGRSDQSSLRVGAMRLIAQGRQGKLAYVLTENLHNPEEMLSKAAIDALIALAQWVARETASLQSGTDDALSGGSIAETAPMAVDPQADDPDRLRYQRLCAERPEIESAVSRAINLHRGKHGQDLVRAALLLADWPGSKTLAIVQAAKHTQQSPIVRRLQLPPDADYVPAFLLAASHGHLRSHFSSAFSRIDQPVVLDALLHKTHWLKDNALQLCLHQVTRGMWLNLTDLARELERHDVSRSACVTEWLAGSGLHDVEQDERMALILERLNRLEESAARSTISGRVCLLRAAMRRRRGACVNLLRTFLADPDERVSRMAAREFIRRKPADYENTLLKLMTTAAPSIRQVIGRVIGQAGFDNYWQRFDKLDRSTRKQAGRAMLKLLPDATARLHRRAIAGTPEQRVKALQIVQELGIAETMKETLVQLCTDPNARVRSKAVTALGAVPSAPSDTLIERLLHDTDSRVRANAVEVLEARGDAQFVPVLTQRARGATNRERANAIRAMHRMKVGTAGSQLLSMLRDQRSDHRISALWALRQIGWWQLLNEVGNLAKADQDMKVRRYAVGVLKTVSDLLKAQKKAG
jgi:hypothetical protein